MQERVSEATNYEVIDRYNALIAETTEKNINYKKRFFNTEFQIANSVDAVSHATCSMAINLNAKAIAVCSLSGRTARMVSRFTHRGKLSF